jgi:glycosyltransferase involved in cell wall biosynthesis
MRILFLSHYFPPEVNAPATRTFEHCARWVRAGHAVTVVTCAPNCPNGILYPGYKNRLRRQIEYVQGVRVVRVWTHLAPKAGTVRRIVNYLSFMVSATLAAIWLPRPDVVVATSPQFFCGWAGVLVSWLKWRPFVLEIRDIWPESIEAVGAMRNRPLLWMLRKMEVWMYRAATHIVAVGEGYRRKILEKADVQDRISVITNGVDLRRFTPARPDPRFLHIWDLEGKFVCSYIGTIGMAHGLEVAIEAAKMLKQKGRQDIAFVLVGDGASRQRLEEQARESGVSDMVVFTGRQPKEEMPAILASSDACLVHLKKCELFTSVMPSKIFETMAMCRPIIMGVEGEACDIVLDAGAGVKMEPDSAASLVDAVEMLADNRDITANWGRMAREYVTDNFDRDVLAARFLRLLQELTGEKGDEVAPLPVAAETATADSAARSSFAGIKR